MKKIIFVTIAALILLAGLGVDRALALEKITLAFSWFPYGKHVPFFVSLDKGFWKEEGLDVTIIRGYGSGDTIKKVAAGSAEFGKAAADVLVTARAEGIKVKIIGAYHDKNLQCVYALKKGNIKSLKDLEGKTMGNTLTDSCRVMFPALAAINKIDPDKVKWINMDAPSKLPSLVTGKIDATCTLYTEDPTYVATAKKAGEELVRFMYSDYGLDLYSISLITTDKMINERPETVKKFLKGTYRGFAWSIEHPEEALEIFIKERPEIDKEQAREHFKIMLNHFLTPIAYEKGMGYIREDKMRLTRDITTQYILKTDKKIPLDELYTNAFLPGIFPPKKK
jgi:NitT/TauT family transport system substrate-binding protein